MLIETPRTRLNIAKLSECTLVEENFFLAFVDKEGNKVDLFIRETREDGTVIPIVIKHKEKI